VLPCVVCDHGTRSPATADEGGPLTGPGGDVLTTSGVGVLPLLPFTMPAVRQTVKSRSPAQNRAMASGLDLRSGPWSADAVRTYLRTSAIPLRLASAGRFPLVQSLWFLFEEDTLWCATQAESVVARRLGREPRCGWEVAADLPPYRGVRGSGHATLVPEAAADVLPRLIDRYLGDGESELGTWLMSRLDTEVAIRIEGLRVTSWDYTPRMRPEAAHG
jgi:hypothetical protein